MIDATTAEHAETAVHTLIEQARTVATAESLTGGLICAALTMVPGSSATVRGGVVVYATELKSLLTGIAADVVRRHGPVSAEVAAAMAGGVRNRLTADLGVAATGVAGPDAQDGHPPGTVHIAVADPRGVTVRSYVDADRLAGDRADVRRQTVRIALEMVSEAARPEPGRT